MHSNVSSLINDQINNELYSSYVYLDIANYYESKGLDGFANWFEIQAKEELDHALLLYKYLQNNGQKVTFEAIKSASSMTICLHFRKLFVMRSSLQHALTTSMQLLTATTITEQCSFLTGSLKNRVKKKRMLLISLLKWNYSVMIQEHFTCSTVN